MNLIKRVLAIGIIAVIVLSPQVQARNNAAVAGAALATVALVSLLASDDCEYEPYQNYVLNKKHYVNPGNALIDYKTTVCKRTQWYLMKDIGFTNNKITVLADKSKSVYTGKIESTRKINVARSNVSQVDQLSGKEPEMFYATFDQEGKLISFDQEITALSEQDVGTKLLKHINEISLTDNSFSQEILYSGVIGDELHLTYREYQSNLIKAAFTQNLVFDLSKSKEITVKDYHLEIIEATNNHLVYKVLSSDRE